MTTESRNEQYPALPFVDWRAPMNSRQKRREAVEARNVLIGETGAGRAVAVVGGGSIGAGKIKEAKKK